MNYSHFGYVTWGSSLPTELKDILGHASVVEDFLSAIPTGTA